MRNYVMLVEHTKMYLDHMVPFSCANNRNRMEKTLQVPNRMYASNLVSRASVAFPQKAFTASRYPGK